MKERERIVYEAKRRKKGFRELFSDLSANWWLLQQLYLRDLTAVYKQSFLGVFWVMVNPLMTLTTFFVLNSSGILSAGQMSAPYPVFAIIGLSLWQVFSSGLLATSSSITSAGDMIRKINFPREVLVFASMAQPTITFTVNILLMIPILLFYGYAPSPYILALPFFALPIISLALGIGLIFSLINAVTHDTSRMLGPLMTFLLFMTPIMYSNPHQGFIGLAAGINPLYYLIDQPRTLILTGTLTEPIAYTASAALSFLTFIVCWKAFHTASPKIAERV